MEDAFELVNFSDMPKVFRYSDEALTWLQTFETVSSFAVNHSLECNQWFAPMLQTLSFFPFMKMSLDCRLVQVSLYNLLERAR